MVRSDLSTDRPQKLRLRTKLAGDGGRNMAQALSEEEFQRMQTQLLELRTNNYQLSDELRKNGVGEPSECQ